MPSTATRPAGTDAPIEPIQLKNFEGPVLAAEELAAIAKHKHVPIPSDADGGKRSHSAVPYIVVGLLLVTMAYVAVKYGVGHVPNYTPYFFGFAAFFFVMERLAPLFSNAVSSSYRSSNEHVKRNWDIRIVAVVHAIVSSYGAYLVLASGLLDHDKLFGENFNCSMLYCFTFGYFIWDLVCCCRHYELFGPGFLAHAICCTILFSNMMRPYCQYYGSVFILYELSTPFVNFHWFFDKTGMSGHWLQIANGVITIGLFVFVRIGYGFYQSYFFFAETLSMLRDRSSPAAQDPFFPIEAAIYLTANVILNSLNVVWLRAMVLSVLSRTGGKSKKTSKAN